MLKNLHFAAALVFTALATSASANELVLPRQQLLEMGLRPVEHAKPIPAGELNASPAHPAYAPHSLAWPVEFEDSRHTIGNVMTQFQDYGGGSYYHGGDDLRVRSRAWVVAPVTGRLEAGHYGYDTLPDGSNKKYWTPWPGTGSAMYFEVALIDADGYRFELHHIDRDTMPAEIVDALKKGNVTIKAGTRVGRTVRWPNSDTDSTLYNHTHYNIIAPDGTHFNPEYYSAGFGDTTPPVITHVVPQPDEIVVAAYDKLGDNVYLHTPSYSRLVFENGAETVWDFRERLTSASGAFPPIWEYFRESVELPNGERLETSGNYSSRSFLLRLKVPAGARGAYRIEIGDSQGNIAVHQGTTLAL